MTSEERADRYRAPALDKGLDILELLSDFEEGISQIEIAKALDRTPNEIYRMLDRLVRRGYVVRTSSDRYELTLKLFDLAHRHPPMRRLVAQALPRMRRFAREAAQACHLVIYDRGGIIVVAQVDAPGYWGIAIRVGAHISLLNTGSGHVLLAFATDEERAFMLEEHERMPHETEPEDLEGRLVEVRRRGYETMPSLQTVGVSNLSTPVRGPGGTVLAALTCPHLQRLDSVSTPSRDEVIALLVEAARDISAVAGEAEIEERTDSQEDPCTSSTPTSTSSTPSASSNRGSMNRRL